MEPIVVGIDFGKEAAQISYYSRSMQEPETISAITGREQFTIPMILCKQDGKNRWVYGEEAKKTALKGEGLLITKLLEKAVGGNALEIEGESYSYLQLLVMFLRKMWSGCLSNLGEREISACMISVETLTGEMIDLLYELAEFLPIDSEKVYFQSHGESFYYYVLHQNEQEQKKALPALLIEEQDGTFQFYHLEYRSSAARLTRHKREMTAYGRFAGSNEEERDRMFLELMQMELESSPAGLVYLIGDFFEGGWMKDSLKYICRGRRAFLGNNLFSKGCAYAACCREEKREEPWLYLGENQLRRELALNLGDRVCRLTKLGECWYEADAELELVLEETDELEFLLRDETEEIREKKRLRLEGLPRQKGFITAVHMEFSFTSPTQCQVAVSDMGFGEITPSGGGHWETVISWQEESGKL